ncbi:unnamed protein product [Heterobilharzia americana]|nr:unnamed protein product [Heterobilharzia americana]
MHSNIERQISTTLDESDEMSKKSDFLPSKNVRIKTQSSITSKSSTSSTITLLSSKDNSGRIIEVPMDASIERASMINAPQLKLPTTKVTITGNVTNLTSKDTGTVSWDATNPVSISSTRSSNPLWSTTNITKTTISAPTITTVHSNNPLHKGRKLAFHQYSSDYSTSSLVNESDEEHKKIDILNKKDSSISELVDCEEYSFTCDDSDHNIPLLSDDKTKKKLCNSVESINHHHYPDGHKRLNYAKSNMDKVSSHNNRLMSTTFIDTCLTNENVIKAHRNKIEIESPMTLNDGKKFTKLTEPYEFTIIENPMGLEEINQCQHYHEQQLSQSTALNLTQPIRTKSTIISSIKPISIHNKSRQSIIAKLSKLPDVVEDSDELGEKHWVYSCSTNIDSSCLQKKLSPKVELNNLNDLITITDNKKKTEKNYHQEGETDLLSSELESIENKRNSNNNNNNNKSQIKQVEIPSSSYSNSVLQEELLFSDKLIHPNYAYHNEVDFSKHIDNSCDEVKKWWRSQLYPNSQILQQQQRQRQQHQQYLSHHQQHQQYQSSSYSQQNSIIGETENVSPVDSPRKKQIRSQQRTIPSLGSKRRSGAAAIISRRPPPLHHHHHHHHQQKQQSRLNNRLTVTIDESTNDDIDGNNYNNNNNHTLTSTVKSSVGTKERSPLPKV